MGIKLDFKDPEAVEPSLLILENSCFPPSLLILHANVFSGPDGQKPPFEKEGFVFQCRSPFPGSILSFGFTTSPGSPPFSLEKIEDALCFAQNCQPATVCIRVELATKAIEEMMVEKRVAGTLWSDQDAPRGKDWWETVGGEIISSWENQALMDFPDFLNLE